MKSKKITAIVLSRRDFNEADRILSVFSLEYGRIDILAKGSRKIKSKMAGHIEPFTLAKYQLVEGRSFDILTGAETINSNENISKNINLFKDASYLCELIKLSIPEAEEEENLFNLATGILNKLPKLNRNNIELTKRYFEFQILSEIGYKPELFLCKKCRNEIQEGEKYKGGFEGIYCCDCKGSGVKISKNTLKLLRQFQKLSYDRLLSIKITENNLKELKEVIYPYICDILPRLPKSEEF